MTPTAPLSARKTPVALRLNRNFMNYPLARDARTKVDWEKSEKTGRWVAPLPGEDRVLLILSSDMPKKALPVPPTALDMHVLFTILAEVQRTGSADLQLRYAAFLRSCGMTVQNQNRKAIKPALWLWSKLTLQIDCWHFPVEGQRRIVLPPPIVTCEHKGRVTVTIHEKWLRLTLDERYFETVNLPLPQRAVEQNAALMVLTSAIKWQEPDNRTVALYQRGQSWFARKIGLSVKNRRARLKACMTRVAAWMAQRGGELITIYGGEGVMPRGRIGFIGTKPKPARVSRREFERRDRGSSNVGIKPRKGGSNVGGNMNLYEVRKERLTATSFASRIESKKVGDVPIKRSQSRPNSNRKQNWKLKQRRLRELEDAMAESSWMAF